MHMISRTTAAVGAAGLIAAGLASAAPASAASGDIFQIKVNEIQTDFTQSWSRHDLPEAGDSFSFTSNLRQNGHRVGKDAGECTFKKIYGESDDPDSAKIRCDVTFHFFHRGTIRAVGTRTVDWDDLVDSTIDKKFPVVDGTNRYDDAGGTVRINQVNDEKAQLTFRLTGVSN
jgi:hypothetical protein